MLLGVVLTARWFVVSGRLKTFLEQRVREFTGMELRVRSLHFSWPLGAKLDDVILAVPGREDEPLFTCQTVRIRGTLGGLLRRRLASLTLISPTISIKENGEKPAFPAFPSREGGGGFSLGAVGIMNGQIDVDMSELRANVQGITSTMSEPLVHIADTKNIRVSIGTAEFAVKGEATEIPVVFKNVDAKFSIRPKPEAIEIEAHIDTSLTANVPYLLLPPDIPVGLSFAVDYSQQRNSLENGIFDFSVPLFSDVRLFGSIANLSDDSPTIDLSLTVTAPEIAELLEYNELFQRPIYRDVTAGGILRLTGEVTGKLGEPTISLTAETRNTRIQWKDIELKGAQVEIPLIVDGGRVTFGPGSMKAERVFVPVKGEAIEANSVSASFFGDTSHLSVKDLSANLKDIGRIEARGTYDLDSGIIRATSRLSDASVTRLLSFVSSAGYEMPAGTTAAGKLDFECTAETALASGMERVQANYRLSLEDGEVSSGEFMMAAGIHCNLTGDVGGEPDTGIWIFNTEGDVGNFEMLIQSFYKDFSNQTYRFSASGEYSSGDGRLRDAITRIDLGRIGEMTARGEVKLASQREMNLTLESGGIDLDAFFEEFGEQLFSEPYPFLRGATIGGVLSGRCALGVHDDQWNLEGSLRLAEGSAMLGEDVLEVTSASASLPFSVFKPRKGVQAEAVSFTESDYGVLSFDNVAVGPIETGPLAFEVAIKENSLRIRDPKPVNVLKGTVDFGRVNGDRLLDDSARVSTSLTAHNIDLRSASEAFGLPVTLDGSLNARFPSVVLIADSLITEGAARIETFGGTIDIDSVGVDQPLSPVRTFKADVEFRNMDLSQITEAVGFGRISGIMEGTLEGLEISQGQAAAFVADFETVDRRGVSQRINFDAVQNITILGTGRGFQASVSRGFASFFNEFRYDKIGFHMSLKNDNFRMKGKVVEGDTEYFVKGVFFGPSINVINRNPGQTISFKSMLERINRVRTKEAAGENDDLSKSNPQ